MDSRPSFETRLKALLRMRSKLLLMLLDDHLSQGAICLPGWLDVCGVDSHHFGPTFNLSSASALPCVSLAMSAGVSDRRSRKARPFAFGAYG